MALLSSGPIDNSPVLGIRPTKIVTIKIVNRSAVNVSRLVIQGFVLGAVREMYVSELVEVGPNEVLTRNYFADLDAFEYALTTEVGEDTIGISIWGKMASGELVDVHRIVSWELEGKEL